MPKELTHWLLAERTLCSMHPSDLKEAIRKYRHLYDIGAVVLDSPYYFLTGKDEAVSGLGKKLHGKTGFNLFHHLAAVLKQFDFRPPDSFWAFAAGMITHVNVDIAFHPLIFYFSGSNDIADPDVRKAAAARHRKLEAFLDLYLMKDNCLINDGMLSKSFRCMKVSRKALFDYTGRLFFGGPHHTRATAKILGRHAHIQPLFKRRTLYRLLSLINCLPGIHLDPVVASFYPVRERLSSSFFDNRIVYRHPVTGVTHEASILELEQRVIDQNLEIFEKLNRDLNRPAVEKMLLSRGVVSLETGMVPTDRGAMTHFDLSSSIEERIRMPASSCASKGPPFGH
jgi:hypothetical protein